jgi:hypothetical protein
MSDDTLPIGLGDIGITVVVPFPNGQRFKPRNLGQLRRLNGKWQDQQDEATDDEWAGRFSARRKGQSF